MDHEIISQESKTSKRLLFYRGLVSSLILFNIFFWYKLIGILTSPSKPHSVVPLPIYALAEIYELVGLWIFGNLLLGCTTLIVRPKKRVT